MKGGTIQRLLCLLAIIKYVNSSKEELMASKYLLSLEGKTEEAPKNEFSKVLAVLDDVRFKIEKEQLKYQAINCSTSKTQQDRNEDEKKSQSDKTLKNAMKKVKRKTAQQRLREKEQNEEDDPKIREIQKEISDTLEQKKDDTQKGTTKDDSTLLKNKYESKGEGNAIIQSKVYTPEKLIRKDISPLLIKSKPISDGKSIKTVSENNPMHSENKKAINDTSNSPSMSKLDMRNEVSENTKRNNTETLLQNKCKPSNTQTTSMKISETTLKSKSYIETEIPKSIKKHPSNNLDKLKKKSADKYAAIVEKIRVEEEQKLKLTPKIIPATESDSSELKQCSKLSDGHKDESSSKPKRSEESIKYEISGLSENQSKKVIEVRNAAHVPNKDDSPEKPKKALENKSNSALDLTRHVTSNKIDTVRENHHKISGKETDEMHSHSTENSSGVGHQVETIKESSRKSPYKAGKVLGTDPKQIIGTDRSLHKVHISPNEVKIMQETQHRRSQNESEKKIEMKPKHSNSTVKSLNKSHISPGEGGNIIESGRRTPNNEEKLLEDNPKHLTGIGKGLEKSQKRLDSVREIRDSGQKSLDKAEIVHNTACETPKKIEITKESFHKSTNKRVPETFSKNPNISCASVIEKSKYEWSPNQVKSERVLSQTMGSGSMYGIKNYQMSNKGGQTSNAEYVDKAPFFRNCPPRQRKQLEEFSSPYQYSQPSHQSFNKYNNAMRDNRGHIIPNCNPFIYAPTHMGQPSFHSSGIIQQTNHVFPHAHHASVSQNPIHPQLPTQKYIAQHKMMQVNYPSKSNINAISRDSKSISPKLNVPSEKLIHLKQKSTSTSPFSSQQDHSTSLSPQPSLRRTSIVITPPPDQPGRKIDWDDVASRRKNPTQSQILSTNTPNAESWSELSAKEVPRERWANSDPNFQCRSLFKTSSYLAPEEHNILGRWINPNSIANKIPQEDIFSPLVDNIYHRYRSSFYDIIFTEAIEYEQVQYAFCENVRQMVIDNSKEHNWGRLDGKVTLPINPIQPSVVRIAVLLRNTLARHIYNEAAFNCVIRWTSKGNSYDKNFFVSLGPKHDLTSWFIYTGTGEWGGWEDMMDEDSNPVQVWAHTTIEEERRMDFHRIWKQEKLKRAVRNGEIISEVDLDRKSPWLSRGKDSIQILCAHYSSK